REEQEDLFTLCAHLPLTAKEHVEELMSRFLYGKEVPGVDESLLSFFAGQSLNICPLTYREDADLLCRKAKELLVGKERSQDAVRSIWQGILNNADFTQSCVVFDGISFLGATVLSFRADFSVNPYYLSLLEETYNVKMGALVGLTEYYSDYASLTLQTAKEHSVICRAYQTGDAASEDFSLHVVWDEPVQNKTGYKHKVTVRGFLSLTDKVTQNTETVYFDVKDAHVSELSIFSLASYYVKQYDGLKADMVAYSRDETLLSVLRASNIIGFPDYASEEEIKLSFLQKDLADGLAEALAVSEVRYCGEKYENYDTPAIWVQYLGDNYASDSRVRPAYIYFPGKYDPTAGSSTVNTMLSKGIKRVFCFIGIPVGIKGEKFPGIVCVHGGGGHSYGQYVLEAVNHGYAAIAIDTDG
ncbi:MAG: hypothetical protein MJ078_07700, partial [Clostridia bacterium]|nr:hypothetical protein [Clostridia bacterium]